MAKKTPWNKGMTMPPEYGEKRRHSFLGHTHTLEAKRKISEANKGHAVTTEMRNKMSAKAKERIASGSPNWKGGHDKINAYGYVLEFNPLLPLPAQKGGRFTPRYRRVMEGKLGRKLIKGETVHHINGIKSDDRPENLYLYTLSSHRILHNEMSRMIMEMYIKGLVIFNDGRYSFSQQIIERMV